MDPADFALEYIGGGIIPASQVEAEALKVVPKDGVVSKLIPGEISECALWVGKTEHCASDDVIEKIAEKFSLGDDPIEEAKEKFGCETEKCVLSRASAVVPEAARELVSNFKVPGSVGSNLLSDRNIDMVMSQFGLKFADFFPYNFNMRNYASQSFRNGVVIDRPDTLATIQWRDLASGAVNGRKYTRCCCVINSDKYEGKGKHWMALYADSGARTVEFFNSSGNAPAPEWINWMVKTRAQMEEIDGKKATIMRVTAIRHQKSKSECGVYSLFYIWARLNGVPASYFTKCPVPDQYMFEFRQHIFDDPTQPHEDKFSWTEFAAKVNLKWERS